MTTPIEALVDFIVSRRNELGLSQRQVAEAAGINPGTLANIEAGRVTKSPAISTLEKLSQGLRIDPSVLISIVRSDGGETARQEQVKPEPQRGQLGAIVRRERELLEATIEELADEVDISPERLEKIESGELHPTAEEVRVLADMLQEDPVDYLQLAGYSPDLELSNFLHFEALPPIKVPANLKDQLDDEEIRILHKVSAFNLGSVDPRNNGLLFHYDRSARKRILRHFEAIFDEDYELRQRLNLPQFNPTINSLLVWPPLEGVSNTFIKAISDLDLKTFRESELDDIIEAKDLEKSKIGLYRLTLKTLRKIRSKIPADAFLVLHRVSCDKDGNVETALVSLVAASSGRTLSDYFWNSRRQDEKGKSLEVAAKTIVSFLVAEARGFTSM